MAVGEQSSHDHTTIAVKFPVHEALEQVSDDYHTDTMNDTVAWLLWYRDLTLRFDEDPEVAEEKAGRYVSENNVPPIRDY